MNIIQINTEASRGGAAKIATTLNDAFLGSDSFKSALLYGRGLIPNSDGYYKFTIDIEVLMHLFITRFMGLEGKGSSISTNRLLKHISSNDITLVHLHNLHGYYLNFKMLIDYLKDFEIPVVWTLHDCWPFTGSCAYFMDCFKYKTGCGSCPYKSNYPKNYFDASGKMWSIKKDLFAEDWKPVIVTPSGWLKTKVKGSFLKKHRVEVIPNGIDTEMFWPIEKDKARSIIGLPKHKKVLLYVAMDLKDERKGAKYFIEAIHKLSSPVEVTVITVGKEYGYRFDNSIDFREYGYIKSKEELSHIYSAADVFCITALDDNFPTTVLEAMACGTPVVGFDVGGISEQVTPDCGIVVTPKDSDRLAEAMTDLLINGGKRALLGKNCRQRVEANYSKKLMLDRYINLYRELLS